MVIGSVKKKKYRPSKKIGVDIIFFDAEDNGQPEQHASQEEDSIGLGHNPGRITLHVAWPISHDCILLTGWIMKMQPLQKREHLS